MKITLRKILYLIAFIGFTYSAKAQNVAIPDTTRLSVGLDGGSPNGGFSNSYQYSIGASLQVDVPLTEKLYFTGNLGFNSFFPQSNIGSNPEAILNVKVAHMNIVPLKAGLKYFLIRGFYVQGEVGESLLINKSAVYALNSLGLTYAPQMGIVFKLKNNRKYIDAGVRFERTQSFYGDGGYNNFFALRIAYAFNLK